MSNALSLPQNESARLLSRWHNAGWLKRLKRGMYWPIPLEYEPRLPLEDDWLVVDRAFSPGYIGGFSAIKHWDFTEQLFITTFYLTTKPVASRKLVLGSFRFKLKTIKPYKMFWDKNSFGEKEPKSRSLILQKTIIDLLDDPYFVGGMRVVQDFFMEYWKSKHKDIKLLIQYGKKDEKQNNFQKIGLFVGA